MVFVVVVIALFGVRCCVTCLDVALLHWLGVRSWCAGAIDMLLSCALWQSIYCPMSGV